MHPKVCIQIQISLVSCSQSHPTPLTSYVFIKSLWFNRRAHFPPYRRACASSSRAPPLFMCAQPHFLTTLAFKQTPRRLCFLLGSGAGSDFVHTTFGTPDMLNKTSPLVLQLVVFEKRQNVPNMFQVFRMTWMLNTLWTPAKNMFWTKYNWSQKSLMRWWIIYF